MYYKKVSLGVVLYRNQYLDINCHIINSCIFSNTKYEINAG